MINYTMLSPQAIEKHALNITIGAWGVATTRPLSTLLGSCVSVCLIDTGIPIVGMNHFMLPKLNRGPHARDGALLAGDACMDALINAMLKKGAAKHRMKAKAFGGGNVINAAHPSLRSVGRRNADFACEWLERERIPLLASDLLGPWSRKIVLVPSNGDAYCRRYSSNLPNAEALRLEEKAYAESLSRKKSW